MNRFYVLQKFRLVPSLFYLLVLLFSKYTFAIKGIVDSTIRPKRSVEEVHKKSKGEEVVKLKNASVVIANYDLINKDFPHTKSMDMQEINNWLISQAGYMAVSQVKYSDKFEEQSKNGKTVQEVEKDILEGNIEKLQKNKELFNESDFNYFKAHANAIKKYKNKEDSDSKKELSKNMRLTKEKISKYLAVNTKIPILENEIKKAYRPPEHGRALLLEVEDNEGNKTGIMDIKGIGSLAPSQDSHRDGVATLGEALREYNYTHVIGRIVEHSKIPEKVVGIYAVIDPGFKVVHKDQSTSPAGLILRQAHSRFTKVDNSNRKKLNPNDVLQSVAGDGWLRKPIRNAMAEVLKQYGIFTGKSPNIQGTRSNDLFDFGHYIVRPDIGNKNLELPFSHWGHKKSDVSYEDPKDRWHYSKDDRPWQWAHETANSIANNPNKDDARFNAYKHFEDMVGDFENKLKENPFPKEEREKYLKVYSEASRFLLNDVCNDAHMEKYISIILENYSDLSDLDKLRTLSTEKNSECAKNQSYLDLIKNRITEIETNMKDEKEKLMAGLETFLIHPDLKDTEMINLLGKMSPEIFKENEKKQIMDFLKDSTKISKLILENPPAEFKKFTASLAASYYTDNIVKSNKILEQIEDANELIEVYPYLNRITSTMIDGFLSDKQKVRDLFKLIDIPKMIKLLEVVGSNSYDKKRGFNLKLLLLLGRYKTKMANAKMSDKIQYLVTLGKYVQDFKNDEFVENVKTTLINIIRSDFTIDMEQLNLILSFLIKNEAYLLNGGLDNPRAILNLVLKKFIRNLLKNNICETLKSNNDSKDVVNAREIKSIINSSKRMSDILSKVRLNRLDCLFKKEILVGINCRVESEPFKNIDDLDSVIGFTVDLLK